MGVEDPAVEGGERRRPDDSHVAGQNDDVDRGGRERFGDDLVIPTRDQGGLDPLLRGPVDGRAGPIREDEGNGRTQVAARRGRAQRPQIAPRSRDADGDPAAAAQLTISRPSGQRW
jgi:hypothetical protein